MVVAMQGLLLCFVCFPRFLHHLLLRHFIPRHTEKQQVKQGSKQCQRWCGCQVTRARLRLAPFKCRPEPAPASASATRGEGERAEEARLQARAISTETQQRSRAFVSRTTTSTTLMPWLISTSHSSQPSQRKGKAKHKAKGGPVEAGDSPLPTLRHRPAVNRQWPSGAVSAVSRSQPPLTSPRYETSRRGEKTREQKKRGQAQYTGGGRAGGKGQRHVRAGARKGLFYYLALLPNMKSFVQPLAYRCADAAYRARSNSSTEGGASSHAARCHGRNLTKDKTRTGAPLLLNASRCVGPVVAQPLTILARSCMHAPGQAAGREGSREATN